MKKKILDIAIIVLAAIFIICGFFLIKEWHQVSNEGKDFDEIRTEADEDNNLPFDKNDDMIGWLKVEGTKIDYPVMLTPDEPEKYLHLNFEGEYSYSGTPFMDYRCDLSSDNMIIYGHNMLNKSMFSTLSLYDDEEFYEDNGIIEFTTESETRKYKIMAAVKTTSKGAKVIYNFITSDEAGYDSFVSSVKDMELYDTDVSASYKDQLITLSTCAYHEKNGRFIVIGKRVE